MTTPLEAIDDIHARFFAVWQPLGHPAVYANVPPDDAMQAAIDAGTITWARIGIKHNLRTQGTLAGPEGSRRDSKGVVLIEIYTPSGIGTELSTVLATAVINAYEGVATPNGVWFFNVRMNEIGPDGNSWHCNVVAEFQYDTVA